MLKRKLSNLPDNFNIIKSNARRLRPRMNSYNKILDFYRKEKRKGKRKKRRHPRWLNIIVRKMLKVVKNLIKRVKLEVVWSIKAQIRVMKKNTKILKKNTKESYNC